MHAYRNAPDTATTTGPRGSPDAAAPTDRDGIPPIPRPPPGTYTHGMMPALMLVPLGATYSSGATSQIGTVPPPELAWLHSDLPTHCFVSVHA